MGFFIYLLYRRCMGRTSHYPSNKAGRPVKVASHIGPGVILHLSWAGDKRKNLSSTPLQERALYEKKSTQYNTHLRYQL